jgi:hypothetical protein
MLEAVQRKHADSSYVLWKTQKRSDWRRLTIAVVATNSRRAGACFAFKALRSRVPAPRLAAKVIRLQKLCRGPSITNKDLNCPFNRLPEVATGFEALIMEPRKKREVGRLPETERDIGNIAERRNLPPAA